MYSTTFKLLVVGDAGVGKTCLITRFVDDVFSSTCKSTIGVDFKAHSIEMDGRAVQLQVWDTAGQERFRALTTSYYRGAHGVILVYDVTEQTTYDHLASWIKDVDLYSGEEVPPHALTRALSHARSLTARSHTAPFAQCCPA